MPIAVSLEHVIRQQPSLLDYSSTETLGTAVDKSQGTVGCLATALTSERGENDSDVLGQEEGRSRWATIEHDIESKDNQVEHDRSNKECENSTSNKQPSLSIPDIGATSDGERQVERRGRGDDTRNPDGLGPPSGHSKNKTRSREHTENGKTEDIGEKNDSAKFSGRQHPTFRLNKIQCDYDNVTAKVNCRRSPRNTPPGDPSMSCKFGPASRWGELSKAHLEFRRLGTAGECQSCGGT